MPSTDQGPWTATRKASFPFKIRSMVHLYASWVALSSVFNLGGWHLPETIWILQLKCGAFAMRLSKYRLSTAFPGSTEAPAVGWGKLGCPQESFLMNSSSEGLKCHCFPGWEVGGSILFCYGFKSGSQSPCLEPLMWTVVVLAAMWKIKSVYTPWVIAFCSQIRGKIHSKAAAGSGSSDGWGVAFQEGNLLVLNSGGWHQINWKDLKLSSYLITSEDKLTCDPEAWNFPGPRARRSDQYKTRFLQLCWNTLVGSVHCAPLSRRECDIMCLKPFTWVHLLI